MRPLVENFPFFCIFLAILAGVVSAVIPKGRTAYFLTLCVSGTISVLSALVLDYVFRNDISFTYTMGRFIAPYGNAIKCGPLQALLAMVFSLVVAMSLAGGHRDLFHDVLPEKQRFYFTIGEFIAGSTAVADLHQRCVYWVCVHRNQHHYGLCAGDGERHRDKSDCHDPLSFYESFGL